MKFSIEHYILKRIKVSIIYKKIPTLLFILYTKTAYKQKFYLVISSNIVFGEHIYGNMQSKNFI